MASCGVAQKTVVKVQKRARELKLSWPLDEALTGIELQKLMFSKALKKNKQKKNGIELRFRLVGRIADTRIPIMQRIVKIVKRIFE